MTTLALTIPAVLRCDRCGQEKDDVEVFADKGKLKSRQAEYRLREHLELTTGKKIAGFPKLCKHCQSALRTNGRGLLD
jgi:hypothetical protein